MPSNSPGVDVNDKQQLKNLEEFQKYYSELSYGEEKLPGLRYYYRNRMFSYADAIILYSMIRAKKPRRINEIGSGYSSTVTLDANELYFSNQIHCTFIEPYPERLLNLLSAEDIARNVLVTTRLQDVEIETFPELARGDFLFIDSTHVSKLGSDVNRIFFEIMPKLNEGVFIHFHDIFYPFEYPKEWLDEGRAWNEAYLLRAFLQHNKNFEIEFFNHYMANFYKKEYLDTMPLCKKNTGESIWLVKKSAS